MTREEAIALADTKWWERVPLAEAARFQLFEDKSVMPLSLFQQGLEELLGRPVWTHELGLNYRGIREEALGKAPAPTFDEIMALIPEDKRVVIVVSSPSDGGK